MELLNIFKIFKRHIIIITLITIISGIFGVVIARTTSPTYEIRQYITVAYQKLSAPETFSYENYYGEYASNHITSTILGWFKTPPFTALITESMPGTSVYASKIERSNFAITARTKLDWQAGELQKKIIQTLNDQMDQYNEAANAEYKILETGNTQAKQTPNDKIYATIGVIIGLIGSSILMWITELMRGKIQLNETAQHIYEEDILETLSSKNIKEKISFIKATTKCEREQVQSIFIGLSAPKEYCNTPCQEESIAIPRDHQAYEKLASMPLDQEVIIFIKRGRANISDLKRVKTLIGARRKYLVMVD